MVAAWWRGDITNRKLRVLMQGLPHDSALSRVHTDGHSWGWTEEYLFQSHFLMQQMRFWLVKIQNPKARIQQPKPPKRPFSTESVSERPPELTDEDYAHAQSWQPREETADGDTDQ